MVALLFISLYGCVEEKELQTGYRDEGRQEKGEKTEENSAKDKKQKLADDIKSEKEKGDAVNKYLNNYFPYVHNQKIFLGARFLDIYQVEGTATLQFQKIMKGTKGELWKVTIIELNDTKRNKEELESVRSINGDLFYYFVTKSEIYWIVREKISAANKKKICNKAKLPKDSCIVCRDKEMEVDKEGWHYRIRIENKDIVTFSTWFKQDQESSYFRNITFRKDFGIVKFISRRTVEGAESVELWDNSMYFSKEYSVIEMR